MADNDNEVVPSGWEKRLSRSTGKSINRRFVYLAKGLCSKYPQLIIKYVCVRFRNALLFEFAHQGIAMGLSNRAGSTGI